MLLRLRSFPGLLQRRNCITRNSSTSSASSKVKEEGFNSPLWGWGVGILGIGYGMVYLAEKNNISIEQHMKLVWIKVFGQVEQDWESPNRRHLQLAEAEAEDMLIHKALERPEKFTLRSPELFERASPFGVSVGSQVNLDGVKLR